MNEGQTDALRQAIRDLHGCEARWVEAVPVKETFEGKTVWAGVVQVFDLIGHPTAKRAYAWSHAIDDRDRRRFIVVLHEGPVDRPQAAVRAAIAAEYRTGREHQDG